MKVNNFGGLPIPRSAFIAPRNLPPIPPGMAEARHAGIANSENSASRNDRNSNRAGVLLRQYIDSRGDVFDLNQLTSQQRGNLPFPMPGSSHQVLRKPDGYKLQQDAYVAKIRKTLAPRLLSEGLKEFDSTKDNPPNSQSARFGVKPEADVYKYRLVSWGEAGSGIPLTNNPYSVRPQNAPRVDEGFKRKNFTTAQRETVRSAPYKQVVQDQLNAGLHNSHALASRFLGPETNANIAPATFTNHKDKNWGQGEIQSHLEHALFRMEAKASESETPLFLRCTDYLGKFGELQSRKIKVFLSEPVTDREILAEKGTVKETTLGTFYLPGMISEPENGDLIAEFKKQVSQLERAITLAIGEDSDDETERPPFEMRYKYGICAQDLKPLAEQKLLHGKVNRSNDGLNPVLQRMPKNKITQNNNQETQRRSSVRSSPSVNSEALERINELKENPRVLKRGEEVWQMDEVETVLGHIRRANLEDHIQAQVDSGQLSLDEAQSFRSLGLSHSSSDSSISSWDSSSEDEKSTEKTVELDFEGFQDAPESDRAASDSSYVVSTSSSVEGDSLHSRTMAQPRTPPWIEGRSESKRGPQP